MIVLAIIFPVILAVSFIIWCALRTGALADHRADQLKQLEELSKPRIR